MLRVSLELSPPVDARCARVGITEEVLPLVRFCRTTRAREAGASSHDQEQNDAMLPAHSQPREKIHLDVVGEYADALRNGVKLPPIVTFGDIVGDGFHRHVAHQWAERKTILVRRWS